MIDNETPEVNYLSDVYKPPLRRASTGQRFVNHLVDTIVYYIIVFGLAFIMTSGEMDGSDFEFIFNPFVLILLQVLIYTLFEGITGGKTVGKMLTGTRAVMDDGSHIGMGTALTRTLSRLVPFEAFSAFGEQPWHDKWTDSQVIIEE